MHALHVVHYPVFGGPHNQALRLDAAFRARGIRQTVLVPEEPGNAGGRLRQGGIDVVTMPLSRVRASPNPRLQVALAAGFVPEVAAIRRLIRVRRVDVVVVGGLVNPHAAIAARFEGVPVVWQLLDTRPPMALRRLMMPLVTRLSDVVMTTGMEVARVHAGALSLGDRLVPFFPPVDTAAFRPDAESRAAARAELGVPDGACAIGTVGNLNPQKGHEYLLRAAAHIRRVQPDTVVRVLGAPTPTHAAYEHQLRGEARVLGLEDAKDIFIDPGPRVSELLPAFDVFLLTSVPRSEGVPTVILEAMACGVPVVATDVGAVREVVEDGVTGFVVPPLNPAPIAQATLRLLANDDLRTRMGEEARRRAVERYDVEVCADTHVRAFEAALDHHRKRKGHCMAVPMGEKLPPAELHSLLVCPACHGSLTWAPNETRCQACNHAYPIVHGIPVLLVDQSAAGHDSVG